MDRVSLVVLAALEDSLFDASKASVDGNMAEVVSATKWEFVDFGSFDVDSISVDSFSPVVAVDIAFDCNSEYVVVPSGFLVEETGMLASTVAASASTSVDAMTAGDVAVIVSITSSETKFNSLLAVTSGFELKSNFASNSSETVITSASVVDDVCVVVLALWCSSSSAVNLSIKLPVEVFS